MRVGVSMAAVLLCTATPALVLAQANTGPDAKETTAPAAKSTATSKKKKKDTGKKDAAPPVETPPPELVGPPLPAPEPSLSEDLIIKEETPREKFSRGRIMAAAKFGGLFGWDRLGPSFFANVEVGWNPMIPVVKDALALVIDLGYSQPGMSGSAADPRVHGGAFGYDVTVKQLMLGVSVIYRMTWIKTAKLERGRLVPYLGFGPRFFFTEAEASGMLSAI